MVSREPAEAAEQPAASMSRASLMSDRAFVDLKAMFFNTSAAPGTGGGTVLGVGVGRGRGRGRGRVRVRVRPGQGSGSGGLRVGFTGMGSESGLESGSGPGSGPGPCYSAQARRLTARVGACLHVCVCVARARRCNAYLYVSECPRFWVAIDPISQGPGIVHTRNPTDPHIHTHTHPPH